MKKILFIIGTRPEAIKLSPLLKVFRAAPRRFNVIACQTGQHRELVQEVLDFFELSSDISLDMAVGGNAGLSQLLGRLLEQLGPVVNQIQPDCIIVQGDTSSAFAGALCGFFAQIPVAHVEAGLRTHNPAYPFPEEMNRTLISHLADFHFAPTEGARQNLLKEGVQPNRILLTGNTGIDALRMGMEKLKEGREIEAVQKLKPLMTAGRRLLLVTLHRRENQGEKMAGICRAIRAIVDKWEVQVLFPVHPNPVVGVIVYAELSDYPGVILVPPLPYPAFLWAMQQSCLILTDSGGIQEEAPGIGKEVLLVREQTERPEAVDSRFVQVVGTQPNVIVEAVGGRLAQQFSKITGPNPFGDGYASERILAFLEEYLI